MDQHVVTADWVRQSLRLIAGIDVDDEEAAAVARLVAANQDALQRLDRFDVTDVRPAVLFDPLR